MRPLLALILATGLAVPAGAGSIRGTVRVPAVQSQDVTFHPYAGRASSLPAPARPPRGLVTDAVVYLESLPAGASSDTLTKAPPRLAQRSQAFDPRVVVVSVGSKVEFPNLDPIYHNVFSVSPTKRFDLGKYPRGQSRTVEFTKPGLVNVYCDIHSDMTAFILVVPNRAWARPGPDGRFELRKLPPGRYQLTWWHPDFRGDHTSVEVPVAGDVTQDVNF